MRVWILRPIQVQNERGMSFDMLLHVGYAAGSWMVSIGGWDEGDWQMVSKKTKGKWESAAHIGWGFVWSLFNLDLFLVKREFDQLPPENDDSPVLYIDFLANDTEVYYDCFPSSLEGFGLETMKEEEARINRRVEYWGKSRVMDTLRDSREYVIGKTIAYPIALGLSVWFGMWLQRFISEIANAA
jgi:hypothetical protein